MSEAHCEKPTTDTPALISYSSHDQLTGFHNFFVCVFEMGGFWAGFSFAVFLF